MDKDLYFEYSTLGEYLKRIPELDFLKNLKFYNEIIEIVIKEEKQGRFNQEQRSILINEYKKDYDIDRLHEDFVVPWFNAGELDWRVDINGTRYKNDTFITRAVPSTWMVLYNVDEAYRCYFQAKRKLATILKRRLGEKDPTYIRTMKVLHDKIKGHSKELQEIATISVGISDAPDVQVVLRPPKYSLALDEPGKLNLVFTKGRRESSKLLWLSDEEDIQLKEAATFYFTENLNPGYAIFEHIDPEFYRDVYNWAITKLKRKGLIK